MRVGVRVQVRARVGHLADQHSADEMIISAIPKRWGPRTKPSTTPAVRIVIWVWVGDKAWRWGRA